MRKLGITKILIAALALAFISQSCEREQQDASLGTDIGFLQEYITDGAIIPGKYIVTLSSEATSTLRIASATPYDESKAMVADLSRNILNANQVSVSRFDHVYSRTILGFSCTLDDEQVKRLRQDKRIALIEPDRVIALGPGGGGNTTSTQPPQATPWGISYVGGGATYIGTKKAWIIDSGVDLTHPDLNVNTVLDATFVGGTPADQNGHGTHVAGTIGAKNNTIGVVGVAAGVQVVSVRVLGKNGSGTTSGVIAGVDYVGNTATAGDVANMSLGGGVSTSLDNAVINAAAKGIIFVVAAGNSATSATTSSPARVNAPNVFTISAHNSSGAWASFSNYGNPPVDFCAPGVSVLSTWKGGGYNTISGTSMATPHVAGIAIWNGTSINNSGTVTGDPDGTADLKAHL